MPDPALVRHRIILCVLLTLSSGAYFNTLQAGFTYDDFFAVVSIVGLYMFFYHK